MTELEALCAWNKLSPRQRDVLFTGLAGGRNSGYSHPGYTWDKLPLQVKEDLLKLDWNFMLGGKL